MAEPTLPPTQVPPDEETVTLTIDDREVTVPKGTLVIRAAEKLGIVIPRFCDHPLLDPAGACRQCIVEVEGQRKPMTSCTTEVADEMVVRTHLTSEMAADAQEAQLEFLLINHPLDCPMCDKGGECPLQDQALEHGPGMSRFIDEKRRYAKPVAVSPNVLLDRERCVLCARCTRFAKQISGDPFIELFERGALQQVAIYQDDPYFSYFSGNVIQICPVGALTSASYRFRARPFDLRSKPSVCNLCSAGCNLNVHTRRGGVMRQLARMNMDVNEAWNCDKGRFAFKYLDHDLRITEPKIRKEGDLVAVSWTEALEAAVSALRDAREGGRVAVLTGGRIPNEDAYVVGRYARAVLGTDDVDFRTTTSADDEALAVVPTWPAATYADVEASPLTLLVGLDPEEEVPILYLRLRKAWLKDASRIVPVGPRPGTVSEFAWRWLDTQPGGEVAVLDALASPADDAPSRDGGLEEVRDALRDAVGQPVVLVGERGAAEPGVLAAAGRLAETLGAKLAWVPRRNNARGALDAGLVAGLLPGGRRIDDADDRSAVEALWGELPAQRGRSLHGILEAAANGEIDVLHLIGVDLARDCDDPTLAEAALERTPTVIVQDLLNNETSQFADVLLPAAATQERGGTFTDWEGREQRFAAAIDGPQLVQEDWDIVVQLAAGLGHDLGLRDLASIREERSRLGPVTTRRAWPSAAGTATSADRDAPAGGGLELVTYPTLIDHGVMSWGADELHRTGRAPFVALHESDARRLGIEHGATVAVSSDGGRLLAMAQIERAIVPGVAYVPTNSTETPAYALRDGSARVTVTVEAVDEPLGSPFLADQPEKVRR